jgi:hypothetical protein
MGLLSLIVPDSDDGDGLAGYARRNTAGAQFGNGDGNDASKDGDAAWQDFINASAGGPGIYYPTPTPNKWDRDRPGAITAVPAPPLPPPSPFDTGAAPAMRLPAGLPGVTSAPAPGAALSGAAVPGNAAPGTPTPPGAAPSAPARPRTSAPSQGPYRTIAVGDYQMPLVGSAADASSGASANPAGAPPAQGTGANAWSNFFNRGADALGSIARGGSVLGAVRGQYDDPRSQQTQTQNLTQQMLISRGVPQDIAAAAVRPGNGALLNAAIGQAFGGAQRQAIGAGGATGWRGGNVAPSSASRMSVQSSPARPSPAAAPAQPGNTAPRIEKTLGNKTYYLDRDGHWYVKP